MPTPLPHTTTAPPQASCATTLPARPGTGPGRLATADVVIVVVIVMVLATLATTGHSSPTALVMLASAVADRIRRSTAPAQAPRVL